MESQNCKGTAINHTWRVGNSTFTCRWKITYQAVAYSFEQALFDAFLKICKHRALKTAVSATDVKRNWLAISYVSTVQVKEANIFWATAGEFLILISFLKFTWKTQSCNTTNRHLSIQFAKTKLRRKEGLSDYSVKLVLKQFRPLILKQAVRCQKHFSFHRKSWWCLSRMNIFDQCCNGCRKMRLFLRW